MIRLALVGYGYWGPNLLRNFLLSEEVDIAAVCDLDNNKLSFLNKIHPKIKTTQNFTDVLSDRSIKALAIATPPSTHFSLVKQALESGKDVLIEKPMTTNVKDAEILVALAKKNKRILMVDHTFVYSKPVQIIKQTLDSGDMGKIVAIDSTRINLGLYQRDSNVIEDLAVHDFTIMDYLFGILPTSIVAIGARHFDSRMEDQAYLHVWYPNNLLAHINVSWFSPVKLRRMIICGTKQMLVYDDMEQTEKIKIFDCGVKIERDAIEILKMKVGYRRGNIFSPNIDMEEPLFLVANYFLQSIASRKMPIADADAGLRVVKILEAAALSLKHAGKKVKV